jgi:ribosome recycling factor
METLKKDGEKRMQKSIEALKGELLKLRTGRAHPSILEHVMVDYYGSPVPISQVANVSVQDARTLSISPWEKSMVQAIEKALIKSDLGLNPAVSSDVIRVPFPPLTEERRRDLVKVVKAEAENARVSVRNIRRDINNELKNRAKDKVITEDDQRRAEDEIQKLTDRYVKNIDEICALKEKELMEI